MTRTPEEKKELRKFCRQCPNWQKTRSKRNRGCKQFRACDHRLKQTRMLWKHGACDKWPEHLTP